MKVRVFSVSLIAALSQISWASLSPSNLKAPGLERLPGFTTSQGMALQPDWSYRRNGTFVGYAGMHVADTDGDGRNEIIASGALGPANTQLPADSWFELEHKENGSFDKTFASGSYPLRFNDLTVGDVTGDGRADIVIMYDRSILTYDGPTKSLVGTIALPAGSYGRLHCGNVDSDPAAEILFWSNTGVYICGATSVERIMVGTNFGNSVVTGQVLPDRDREIIISGNGVGQVFNGRTGNLIGTYPDFGGVVTIADTNGDGADEIYGMSGPTLRAFNISVSRTQLWQLILTTSEPVRAGNVLGDGLQELIALNGLTLKLLDPRTGATVGQLDPEPVHPMEKLAAGNVDADGGLELLIAGSSDSPLNIVDASTDQVQWVDRTHFSPFGPAAIADIDRDGVLDLAYAPTRTENSGGVWMIRDGESKLIKTVSQINFSPASPSHCLRTANIDADEQDEIIMSHRGGATDASTIYCYDGVTTTVQWTRGMNRSTRDFVVRDLNGDGSQEVVSGQNSNSSTNLAILNAHTGAHIQTVFLADTNPVVSVRVANVDDEPELEIVVAISSSRVIVFNAQTRAIENSFNVAVSALDVFDTDSDGKSELFIADSGGVTRRDGFGNILESLGQFTQPVLGLKVGEWVGQSYSLIFAAGPRLTLVHREGQGSWSSTQSSESFAWAEHPTFEVADCDGDGNLEVFFGNSLGVSLYEIVDPAARRRY